MEHGFLDIRLILATGRIDEGIRSAVSNLRVLLLHAVLRGMIAMRTSDRLDIGNLPSDYGIGVPVADTQARELSPETQSLNPLEKAERAALLREIDLHHGNISRVASKLGIGRNTLYRKMRRLGIAFPARQSARR